MDKPKTDPTGSKTQKPGLSRRNFVKGAATVAAAAATVPLKPLLGDPGSIVGGLDHQLRIQQTYERQLHLSQKHSDRQQDQHW